MVGYLIKILMLNRKIREQRTGTAEELAHELGISRSKLFDVLDEIRSYGAEIRFDRSRRTYYYKNEVNMQFFIKVDGKKVLSNDDMSEITAGTTFFAKNELSTCGWTQPAYFSPCIHNLL